MVLFVGMLYSENFLKWSISGLLRKHGESQGREANKFHFCL